MKDKWRLVMEKMGLHESYDVSCYKPVVDGAEVRDARFVVIKGKVEVSMVDTPAEARQKAAEGCAVYDRAKDGEPVVVGVRKRRQRRKKP